MRSRGGMQTQEGDLFMRLEVAEKSLTTEARAGPQSMKAEKRDKSQHHHGSTSVPSGSRSGSAAAAQMIPSCVVPRAPGSSSSTSTSSRQQSTVSHEAAKVETWDPASRAILAAQEEATDAETAKAVEAMAALRSSRAANEEMRDELAAAKNKSDINRDEADDLQDKIAALEAQTAYQRELFQFDSDALKQKTIDQAKTIDIESKAKVKSEAEARERAELLQEATEILNSSTELGVRQVAMKAIAEVRSTEQALHDATNRLKALLRNPMVGTAESSGAKLDPARASAAESMAPPLTLQNLMVSQQLFGGPKRLGQITEERDEDIDSDATSNRVVIATSISEAIDPTPLAPPTVKETISQHLMAAVQKETIVAELKSSSSKIARLEAEQIENSDQAAHELAEERAFFRRRHEEMLGKLASSLSKGQRLQKSVDRNDEAIIDAESLRRLVNEKNLALEDAELKLMHEQERANLEENLKKELLCELEGKGAGAVQDCIEALESQLAGAIEASRIACARSEDMKQELQNSAQRHEEDLAAKDREIEVLRAIAAAEEGQPGRAEAKLLEMQTQVQQLEEEKNELLNTLEWKEVEWRNTVEDLQMQLAVYSNAAAAA